MFAWRKCSISYLIGPMGKNDDKTTRFEKVFATLKEMMHEYESSLQVIEDRPGKYYVNGQFRRRQHAEELC